MSYLLNISNDEVKKINQEMKLQRDAKVFKRLLALKLKHKGLTNQEISQIMNVHIDTITDWFKLYVQNGLNALCELHLKNRKKSRLNQYHEEIKEIIEKETISTIGELQNYISKLYGIVIEHSWLYRYCKKNSIFLIKKQG